MLAATAELLALENPHHACLAAPQDRRELQRVLFNALKLP
jgi:hypothetical protein